MIDHQLRGRDQNERESWVAVRGHAVATWASPISVDGEHVGHCSSSMVHGKPPSGIRPIWPYFSKHNWAL